MSTFLDSEKKELNASKKVLTDIKNSVDNLKSNVTNDKNNLRTINILLDADIGSLNSFIKNLKKLYCKSKNHKKKIKKDIHCLKKRHNHLSGSTNKIHGNNSATYKMLQDKNVLYNKKVIYKYNLIIGIIIIVLMLF